MLRVKSLSYFSHLLKLAAATECVSEDIMLLPSVLRGTVRKWLFLIRWRTAVGTAAADT